ncbi:MAG: metallophosphoesterase family protein [Gemmatimonadaceae bacterium]|nr:metallophosphoesterase family protein [Gemmatimonadaceae bacterium]
MGKADRVHVVGLIADTHGVLRARVHDALAGVELILHAGDVGGDDILDELALIAPVEAVYGNTDVPGNPRLKAEIVREIGGVTIQVQHGHESGRLTADALLERFGADVLVYGHTHRQSVTRREGRLVINPGAAGPRRFHLMPSVARLTIRDGEAEVEIVSLPA